MTEKGRLQKVGPDPMTKSGRKKFFDFYKTHKERALIGFLKDVVRSKQSKRILERYLKDRKIVNCLIMGC